MWTWKHAHSNWFYSFVVQAKANYDIDWINKQCSYTVDRAKKLTVIDLSSPVSDINYLYWPLHHGKVHIIFMTTRNFLLFFFSNLICWLQWHTSPFAKIQYLWHKLQPTCVYIIKNDYWSRYNVDFELVVCPFTERITRRSEVSCNFLKESKLHSLWTK